MRSTAATGIKLRSAMAPFLIAGQGDPRPLMSTRVSSPLTVTEAPPKLEHQAILGVFSSPRAADVRGRTLRAYGQHVGGVFCRDSWIVVWPIVATGIARASAAIGMFEPVTTNFSRTCGSSEGAAAVVVVVVVVVVAVVAWALPVVDIMLYTANSGSTARNFRKRSSFIARCSLCCCVKPTRPVPHCAWAGGGNVGFRPIATQI